MIKNDTHMEQAKAIEAVKQAKAAEAEAAETTREETLRRYHTLRNMEKRTRNQEREMELLGKKLEELGQQNPNAFLKRDSENFLTVGFRGSGQPSRE